MYGGAKYLFKVPGAVVRKSVERNWIVRARPERLGVSADYFTDRGMSDRVAGKGVGSSPPSNGVSVVRLSEKGRHHRFESVDLGVKLRVNRSCEGSVRPRNVPGVVQATRKAGTLHANATLGSDGLVAVLSHVLRLLVHRLRVLCRHVLGRVPFGGRAFEILDQAVEEGCDA